MYNMGRLISISSGHVPVKKWSSRTKTMPVRGAMHIKWFPSCGCENSPQPSFHLCLHHSCMATPLPPVFFSLPHCQVARDINSSAWPQVHLHFASLRPLKMTALIASNGPRPPQVKCSSYQLMTRCYAARPGTAQYLLCIWNHDLNHLTLLDKWVETM